VEFSPERQGAGKWLRPRSIEEVEIGHSSTPGEASYAGRGFSESLFLMSPSSLSISKVGPEAEFVLRNLFEHYLHDMSEWFEIDTKADGSYSYDTSSIWRDGYEAYLAKVGDSITGFALVGSAAEWLGDIGACDVHEFFVLRRFRRSGIGQRMATLLWNERPGEWLVRVLEANVPAVPFWRSTISRYSGGLYKEEERVINGCAWQFFRFVSNGA
jgi:predicted acetyltransferase